MSELARDGRGHQHSFVQGWHDVIAIDLNEVVERGGIGDDDDHGRRTAALLELPERLEILLESSMS
jgi:hypothetical protein